MPCLSRRLGAVFVGDTKYCPGIIFRRGSEFEPGLVPAFREELDYLRD